MKTFSKPVYSIVLILGMLFVTSAFAQPETQKTFLTLRDCINIALEKNTNLITSRNSLEAAKMDKLGSYQGILPRIDISAGKGKLEIGASEYLSNEPVGIDPETGNVIYEQRTRNIAKQFRESSSASLSASQTIFDGGLWWNQIRKARVDEQSAQHQLESEIDNTIVSVEQAYFDLLKQMKLLEVYQMAVTRSENQLDRTQKMYELGAKARLDVYQAQVNLGNDRINLLQQENVVKEARKSLNLQMGRDPLTPLEVKADIELIKSLPEVEELVQTAIENQPLLKKGQEDILSRRLSVSMAKGVNYPRVSIYFNYDRFHENARKVFSEFNQNYQSRYGINVSMNLFNGFSDYINIQKSQINERNAVEAHENYKRQLKAYIHKNYVDYNSLLDIIEINKQNLEAAKEEVRLAEERYQIGAGTSIEVREAQVNLTRAEEVLIAAQFNARLILAQLDYQLGLTYKKLFAAE